MLQKPTHRFISAVAILAGSLLATAAIAKDSRTEDPVFEFSSPFVAPLNNASPTHYIWKINRIDGALYLCQTTTVNVRCNQVASPNGELGPFSLSDAVSGTVGDGFYVWRLNRWTGTQEVCVSSPAQKGCSK